MTERIDLDELAQFVTDAAIGGKDRVSLPRAEFAAMIAELRSHRERELSGGWIACSERMPDSDVWVLVCGHEADYVVAQLEFTDDSEGHGEPYWATEGGDLALCNYPHWHALPNPPESP